MGNYRTKDCYYVDMEERLSERGNPKLQKASHANIKKAGLKITAVVNKFYEWSAKADEGELFAFMKSKSFVWLFLTLVGIGVWATVGEDLVQYATSCLTATCGGL